MSDHDSEGRGPVVLVGGGIGAGKSCVSSVFGRRGFHVISTDIVGGEVLSPGSRAVDAVRAVWPEVIAGDAVDRLALAQIVFSDPAALALLEAITHPEIERRVRQRLAQRTTPVAVEVPVLKVFAQEPYTRLAVVADVEVRLKRVVGRGAPTVDTKQRMANQPTTEEWQAWADLVVDNSGAWDATERAVHTLIDALLLDA